MIEVIAVLGPSMTLAAAAVWYRYCIDQTARDRQILLYQTRNTDLDQWERDLENFEKVSFNQHLWRRLTLRNPGQLYDRY